MIPTFNRKSSLARLLDSLRGLDWPSKEVIVVDNGSNDGTDRMVREQYPETRLITYDERRGHHFAAWKGAKSATGDCIAFLEDDIVVPSNWIKEMSVAFRDPQVAIAACTVRNDDGRIWRPVVQATCFGSRFRFIGSTGKTPVDIQYATESGTVLRREVLAVSLLDRGLTGDAWGESISFYTRSRRRGFRAVGVPRAFLLHYPRTSGGAKERFGKGQVRYNYDLYANMTYVYLKYQSPSILVLPLYAAYRVMFAVAHSMIQRSPVLLRYAIGGIFRGVVRAMS